MKLLLLIWIIYPITEAFIQASALNKDNGWKPVYFQLFIIRGMSSIFHGIIMNVQPQPWYDYPIILAFQVTSFWVIFDLLLNYLRHKPLDYRGKTSGCLDRLLPEYLYWTLKVLALTTAIVIYSIYEYI